MRCPRQVSNLLVYHRIINAAMHSEDTVNTGRDGVGDEYHLRSHPKVSTTVIYMLAPTCTPVCLHTHSYITILGDSSDMLCAHYTSLFPIFK